MDGMKLYAVARGHKTGVFDNWEETQEATKGYPDAKFKKVKTFEEGEEFIKKFGVERQDKKDLFSRQEVVASEFKVIVKSTGINHNEIVDKIRLETNNLYEVIAQDIGGNKWALDIEITPSYQKE